MSRQRLALFVRNGLVGHDVLCRLLPEVLDMGLEPVIYNTGEPEPDERASIPELSDFGFYETVLLRDVAFPYLDHQETALATQGGRMAGGPFCSFKGLRDVYGIAYHDVPDVNDPDFIRGLADDDRLVGGLSVRILRKLGPDLIATLEGKGFLANLHTGELPDFRGLHSPLWAISRGRTTYSWTLHRMDNHFDTGPILCRTDERPLDLRKPLFETYLDVAPLGAAVLAKYVRYCLADEALEGLPQTGPGAYFSHPTSQDMQRWEAQGIHFANPAHVPDTYATRLSVPGTPYYDGLRRALIQAVAEYERSVHPAANLGAQPALLEQKLG